MPESYIRVVTLRKGRIRATEFMLRGKEKGLSLFTCEAEEAIEAVRAAGKQGELAATIFTRQQLQALGLTLVRTRGGTPSDEVNAMHYEARLPFLRRLALWLRGVSTIDYFNDHLSLKLCSLAQLLD